jgi:hypothetical protein
MSPLPEPVREYSKEEEALTVAFSKHALLPLDDCLYVLQAKVPNAGTQNQTGAQGKLFERLTLPDNFVDVTVQDFSTTVSRRAASTPLLETPEIVMHRALSWQVFGRAFHWQPVHRT